MALFRKIHTQIWSDTWFAELDSDKKLFYLYIITNEKTKQCGVYEISKRQIAFDLGYSIDRVSKLLQYFIDAKKIRYNDSTNEVAIGNWLKYNNSTSPKVVSCINKEFSEVKDTLLIQYVKSIGTLSQEEEEKEEEYKQEEKEEDTPSDDGGDLKEIKYQEFSDSLIEKYFNVEIYPDRESSYKAIRLLIEKDKVQKEVIEEIVKTIKSDKFWDSNFMSLAKLRKKNSDGVEYWKVWGTKLVNSQQTSKPTILNFDALDGLF